MKIGLVGLPNAGKSTLFNALLKKQLAKADLSAEAPPSGGAKVENRPFTTIDPNIGSVDIPDKRLEKLAKVVHAQKIIPTTLKVIDIAGLVKDAHKGVGLGNQFLAHIREVDLVVYVVRAFEDANIIHVSQKIDPKEDLEILKLELELADEGKTEQRLTDKPSITVLNVSEHQLQNLPETLKLFRLTTGSGQVLPISAKIEAELSVLSPEEQQEYLQSLNLKRSGLDRLLRLAYQRLDLITFFTAGEKEVRAWTVKSGAEAPQAAAKIHTDMQRGFIAADVISWHKLVEANGWKQAKEKGWVRLEGKNYIMKDGDVMIVRFNV